MSPSRKRLDRLERKLDRALNIGEESDDPLRGLVELPPQDTGLPSKPLEEVYERYQSRGEERQARRTQKPRLTFPPFAVYR